MKMDIYGVSFNLMLLLTGLYFSFTGFPKPLQEKISTPVVYSPDTVEIVAPEASEEAFLPKEGDNVHLLMVDLLATLGVDFPEVVWHQVILETGWLKSQVYKKNNNLFGMKRNYRGYCLNTPGKKKPKSFKGFDWDVHAAYESQYESILDFVAWQDMVMSNYAEKYGHLPRTEEEYINMLDHLPIKDKKGKIKLYRYASAKHYTSTLRKLMEYTEDNPLIIGQKAITQRLQGHSERLLLGHNSILGEALLIQG